MTYNVYGDNAKAMRIIMGINVKDFSGSERPKKKCINEGKSDFMKITYVNRREVRD